MAVRGEGDTELRRFPHCLEKVKSKLVGLKKERVRGAGRVKQFYRTKDISLSLYYFHAGGRYYQPPPGFLISYFWLQTSPLYQES